MKEENAMKSYEQKVLQGTLNKTRDKPPKPADPEVSSYLLKVNSLLESYWKKPNDVSLPLKEHELYLDMFLKLQKHYFTFKDYVPKGDTANNDSAIQRLIKNKNA
jgi:hypothetical protein